MLRRLAANSPPADEDMLDCHAAQAGLRTDHCMDSQPVRAYGGATTLRWIGHPRKSRRDYSFPAFSINFCGRYTLLGEAYGGLIYLS